MIAKWKVKALVQKGISYLPHKEKINYWFQKNITKGVELTDEYFGYKINHAKDHLGFFNNYLEKDLNESSVLEIGTGWYPIVPIAFYLNDVKEVNTLDLNDWMRSDNVVTTCRKYVEWDDKGMLDEFLPEKNDKKWNYIKKLAKENPETLELGSVCDQLNLKRLIGDARKMAFEDNTLDLICSNNTLEHIPEEILVDILKEFKRIIKKGGVMSHFIDMTDHFAHFDSSITIYNFLKYSDKAWKRIDNNIQPQNRLRFRDYKRIYDELGIPSTDEEHQLGDMDELKRIPLDSKYESYSLEELAICHSYLVSWM